MYTLKICKMTHYINVSGKFIIKTTDHAFSWDEQFILVPE